LKMWNFNEDYAKEEKENSQVVEGDSDKEMIGKEIEQFKSIVGGIMQKEFDVNEKENGANIRNQASASNDSICKLTVSKVDTKQYLVFEDVIFKKLADMADLMGVEPMGEDGKIVNEESEANLNEASSEEREKDKGNQVSTDLLIKNLPRMLFRDEMDQSAKKQQARELE
jgi:hypothetical protein